MVLGITFEGSPLLSWLGHAVCTHILDEFKCYGLKQFYQCHLAHTYIP